MGKEVEVEGTTTNSSGLERLDVTYRREDVSANSARYLEGLTIVGTRDGVNLSDGVHVLCRNRRIRGTNLVRTRQSQISSL